MKAPLPDQTLAAIRSEVTAGVATITLDQPHTRNALTSSMLLDLARELRSADGNPDVRVVVLTGAGGTFCSGADLSGAGSELHPLTRMRNTAALAGVLARMTTPTLAKVEGYAVGAGCSLALHCDLSVAARSARFRLGFTRVGLSPDFGASWLLPRLIGMRRATELAVLDPTLAADEAASMGLINRAVDDAELDGVVSDIAAQLAAAPPIATSQTLELLSGATTASLDQALAAESAAQAINFATVDSIEGRRAFQEKRAPNFTGRSRLTTTNGAPTTEDRT